MSIIGKSYKRNLDGKTVTVTNVDGDVAILENNQRVNIETLTRSDQFSETINMDAFTGNSSSSWASSLTQQASNINTNNIPDIPDSMRTAGGARVVEGSVVESHSSAQADNYERAIDIQQDPRAIEELKRKAIELQQKGQQEAQRQNEMINNQVFKEEQNESFIPGSAILPDGSVDPNYKPQQTISQASRPIQQVQQPQVQQPQQNNAVTDMFAGFKRIQEFKCKFEVNEMIPDLNLMKMFEMGHNSSIIDYITDDILKKVSSDPNLLRKEIKKRLEIGRAHV